MKNSSKPPSSSSSRSRSEKPNLRSSKSQCKDPIQLSSKTPEKPLERTRTRNRGVALSISDIRKVAKGLQDRNKPNETTSLPAKTARRRISMPSPSKPSTSTSADQPFKLPEKYEILGEFFDCLDNSIRLLRLKGSMASFTNIRLKVESLADRTFTHGHLAQLKFILPEAITIKKLLLFDERTSCMKPDLLVTLNPDAVEPDAVGSDAKLHEPRTLRLRKLFRERLRDFCKSHPQGDEIPEEALPEPFSRPKLDHPLTLLNSENADDHLSMPNKTPIEDDHLSMPVKTPIEVLNQQPAVASYMSQGFRRHFSLKSKKNVADNVEQKFPSDSFQPSALLVSELSLKKNSAFEVTKSLSKSSPSGLASEAASSETCSTIHASSVCFTSSGVTPATPGKTTIEFTEIKDGSLKSKDAMSTPAKPLSTPTRLMSATPAPPPPKRHLMTPDNNCVSSPTKLVRGPPLSRSLKFDTPVKSAHAAAVGGLSIDDDILDILPDNLLQSISEKERRAMEERDPAISQAKKRKKIIASLPKLFNMIHLLFHSKNRSVIPREELISTIISSHCDIVDRSEVEEQLHLLLELVPEWISEKLSLSGDMLFRINKMSNPHTIRASLEEAK